jgi:hypothetical protein
VSALAENWREKNLPESTGCFVILLSGLAFMLQSLNNGTENFVPPLKPDLNLTNYCSYITLQDGDMT